MQLYMDDYVLHALLASNNSFAMIVSFQYVLLHKFTLMCHFSAIVVITGKPAGQVSFVYRMHSR